MPSPKTVRATQFRALPMTRRRRIGYRIDASGAKQLAALGPSRERRGSEPPPHGPLLAARLCVVPHPAATFRHTPPTSTPSPRPSCP